jgi:hypothetical protein
MKTVMKLGGMVAIPDGRKGLLLERWADTYVVRVRHKDTGNYQFLPFAASKLKPVREDDRTSAQS